VTFSIFRKRKGGPGLHPGEFSAVPTGLLRLPPLLPRTDVLGYFQPPLRGSMASLNPALLEWGKSKVTSSQMREGLPKCTWAERQFFSRAPSRGSGKSIRKEYFRPRYPGFPVEVGGVGEFHAAFLNESRTRSAVRAVRNIQVRWGEPAAPSYIIDPCGRDAGNRVYGPCRVSALMRGQGFPAQLLQGVDGNLAPLGCGNSLCGG
jgi:hypothetical protein